MAAKKLQSHSQKPAGGSSLGTIYAGPTALWLSLFFTAPLLIIIVYSFLKRDLYGGVQPTFSLEAYRALINPVFAAIALKTLAYASIATLITIFLALPCGYFMARSKNQTLLLLLVIIPFWTNFLIRVYAWIAILGTNGFLNDILIRIGLLKEGIAFLNRPGTVILVLVYMYLPYAILPLFSTIDKFDFSLLEAARDLGASKSCAMRKTLLPNIKSGIFTAFLFTFIPIFGAYAVPLLVGGMDSYMLGNFIADQVTKTKNWPLASSISMVITAVTTAGVLLMLKLQGRESSKALEQSQADSVRAQADSAQARDSTLGAIQ